MRFYYKYIRIGCTLNWPHASASLFFPYLKAINRHSQKCCIPKRSAQMYSYTSIVVKTLDASVRKNERTNAEQGWKRIRNYTSNAYIKMHWNRKNCTHYQRKHTHWTSYFSSNSTPKIFLCSIFFMTFNENNPGKNAIKMEYAPLSQATACSMHCCLFAFIAVNVFNLKWLFRCAHCAVRVCVSDLYIVNALWLLLYRIFSAFTGQKKRREKNNWFVVTQ